MLRRIKIGIDVNSWSSKNIHAPQELISLNGRIWNVDILCSMIFIALCTRPPISTGLHVNDFWAWLRYRSAISDRPNLMLCKEWNVVDSHQKTILSDEFGVGFTTHLLAEKMNFLCFVDTVYVINILFPKKFDFYKIAKNGAKKTPDYIGIDNNNNFFILECKGTQIDLETLSKAIKRGRSQKENLIAATGPVIKHKLVAGLLIQKWNRSSKESHIIIADPSWDNLEELLSQKSAVELKTSIVQIALAKHLSLIGLNITAQILAETPIERLTILPEQSRSEITSWMSTTQNDSRVLFDSDLLPVRITPGREQERFRVTVPKYIGELAESQSVGTFIQRLSESTANLSWRTFSERENDNITAVVETPLEFKFELEING